MFRETAELYEAYTLPYIASQATDRSLAWVYDCTEKRKETERLLADDSDEGTGGFVINVDTKWSSHCSCLEVPKEDWRLHPETNVNDLYCLGIVKEKGIRTLRDLKPHHIPLLLALQSTGLAAIRETYGVEADQLRTFVHYVPQFFHLHVHFTRLWNDGGFPVRREGSPSRRLGR